MHTAPAFRVVESAAAARRLEAAVAFLLEQIPQRPVTIVGASRGAADDLARHVARARPATIGLARLTLTQLAARSAMVALAADRTAPSAWLGTEAVAARAAFEAVRETSLAYFTPVATLPGFPRALARTLQEVRLAGIGSDRLHALPLSGGDLSDLLERFEDVFRGAAAVDRAGLFQTAAALVAERPIPGAVVLLDLPLDSHAERALVAALVRGAEAVLATVPRGDRGAAQAFVALGGRVEAAADPGVDDLARVRACLFDSTAAAPERALDGSLELFSAPGEGRECVEIARRILAHARAGVRFDEMAVLIRSPQSYVGLIEHALDRAGIPAWFDRGVRRPHPAGRAFLALLACAAEHLSAARFAEYLSLGQVPRAGDGSAEAWAEPDDEALRRPAGELSLDDDDEAERTATDDSPPADAAVVAGTLSVPWRWEALLGEAAVIGGGVDRWQRRLDGYARELDRRLEEAARQDGDEGGRVRGVRLAQAQLAHLRQFAVPLVTQLGSWPDRASWGDWLDRFEGLAPQVLRLPAHVLRALADLRPMASVGPVDLGEARRVLTERLLTLQSEPPARRFGRVFVGTPQQARGRSFRVVFVPGLAERMFPQKPREDPLLLDGLRERLDAALPTQHARLAGERLLLQIAAGAASERLHVSYPRIELSEARERVPSFYALDLMRAATGRLPDHESLQEHARGTGNASLAWPAPADPADAIDDQEHDLAVLRRLLDEPDRDRVKGHAHYLLGLNEPLRRSVVGRWARGERRWSTHDGLVRVAPPTSAALAAARLSARPYSLSALQKYSTCPYQFALSAIFRLQPLDRPEPLQRMDPLTRGSIFHAMQAQFFREMQARRALPVTAESLETARAVLHRVVGEVAAREHDELAPAVERIWDEEVASIRRDLDAWLPHLAADGATWLPIHFEYGFGKVPGERDPGSRREDVVLEGGFRLRGAVDLIEEHRETGVLRVTDHKTGRSPERLDRIVVGGGAVLQPVLYGAAVEAALGRPVGEGRLFYCTAAGGFLPHSIPYTERTRAAAFEVLQVIDRAIAGGFLAAAPTHDACRWCDFGAVCGPDVYRRVSRKPQEPLADLHQLRSRP
jgi:CRISPR/Cas system-associated exonuclease Cas4 (RecB family)